MNTQCYLCEGTGQRTYFKSTDRSTPIKEQCPVCGGEGSFDVTTSNIFVGAVIKSRQWRDIDFPKGTIQELPDLEITEVGDTLDGKPIVSARRIDNPKDEGIVFVNTIVSAS